MIYDVAVIGGGPGGYVCAIKAAQLGLKAVLFERESLGGVCLNKGCIPTKTLLNYSDSFVRMKESEAYGIKAEKITVDIGKMMSRKDEAVKTLVRGVEALVRANGIELVKAEGRIADPCTVTAGNSAYSTRNIVIATGSKQSIPNIEGSRDASVINTDQLLGIKELPSSMTIIGGGVIGIEFGMLLSELGCKVSIIEMLDEILINLDTDVAMQVGEMLVERGISIYTSAKVLNIEAGNVRFEKDGAVQAVKSEKILLATGRVPDVIQHEPDRLGIEHIGGRIKTDERMETNVKGIYAIGDVTGKFMLAHVASRQGIVAAENIAGLVSKMNYKVIPQCIYTHPEVACVGMTEKEAIKNGFNVSVGKFPVHANGKCIAEGNYSGFIKIVCCRETGEILGVHMVCPHAAELISECTLAIGSELTVHDIANTVHPHPSVSEIVMEAANAAMGKAIHNV